MATATLGNKVWTEAELAALPEDGVIHELVAGQLIMSPKNNFESVEVCHSPTQRSLRRAGGHLDGENLLPGFTYSTADLFKGWDWE